MHFPPAFTAVSPSSEVQAIAALWQALAATLESTGRLPGEAVDQCLREVGTGTDPVTLERLEALAECSAALGALVAVRGPGTGPEMAVFPGLRRHGTSDDDQCLRLAAVAVGLGRRAVHLAVSEARARGDRPSGLPHDPPHWLLADAATDVDAARLLVLNTAAGDLAGAAAVLVASAAAAVRATDVAQRLHETSDDQTQTVMIDALARQARALLGIVGGEDALRRRAADVLLA